MPSACGAEAPGPTPLRSAEVRTPLLYYAIAFCLGPLTALVAEVLWYQVRTYLIGGLGLKTGMIGGIRAVDGSGRRGVLVSGFFWTVVVRKEESLVYIAGSPEAEVPEQSGPLAGGHARPQGHCQGGQSSRSMIPIS